MIRRCCERRRPGVQERLEKLRDKAREEDRHDSTLVFEDDAEQARKSTSDLNFERRKQLTGFVDTLNKLKESSGGKDLPGFDNSFLKDPRLPSASRWTSIPCLSASACRCLPRSGWLLCGATKIAFVAALRHPSALVAVDRCSGR